MRLRWLNASQTRETRKGCLNGRLPVLAFRQPVDCAQSVLDPHRLPKLPETLDKAALLQPRPHRRMQKYPLRSSFYLFVALQGSRTHATHLFQRQHDRASGCVTTPSGTWTDHVPLQPAGRHPKNRKWPPALGMQSKAELQLTGRLKLVDPLNCPRFSKLTDQATPSPLTLRIPSGSNIACTAATITHKFNPPDNFCWHAQKLTFARSNCSAS